MAFFRVSYDNKGMVFWERLRKLMYDNNLNQRDIEKICHLTQPSVSRWKQGTIPRADTALKLAKFFGVSVEYLLGEGEEEEPSLIGMTLKGKRFDFTSADKNSSIVYVPFYEDIKASAGIGRENIDYEKASLVPILKPFIGQHNPEKVKMLEVTGDSMIGIHLFHGDLVFFVPVDNPSDGLYVIGIDDNLFVKQIELDIMGNEIRVISKNDNYPPKVLTGEDMSRLRIIGKVIGWITRHPY